MILTRNLPARGIAIEPFANDPKEQVSVDLRVGALYQRGGGPDWLHVEGRVEIHPGSFVLIQTGARICP